MIIKISGIIPGNTDKAEIKEIPDKNGNHQLTITIEEMKCTCYGHITHIDYKNMMKFYQGGAEALFWVYSDVLNVLIENNGLTINKAPYVFKSEFGPEKMKTAVNVQLYEIKKYD